MATAVITPKKKLESGEQGPQRRFLQMTARKVERAADAADDGSEEVELSFSSDVPYERWYGTEILDHSKKSIRMERMEAGAPLLVNHDVDQHVGVVVPKSVVIANGRATARVRFGRSQFAQEVKQDVLDGIRSGVSVGYIVHKFEVNTDTEEYRAIDWEPIEISLASTPADITVGVGRTAEERHHVEVIQRGTTATAENTRSTMATQVVIPAPETVAAANEATQRNTERVTQLAAIADANKIGSAELASWINTGRTVESVKAELFEKRAAVQPGPTPAHSVSLNARESRDFSVMRAIRSLMGSQNPVLGEDAGFEREISEAIGKKFGRQSQGIFIPTNMRMLGGDQTSKVALAQARTLTSAVSNAPVDTILRADSFIELLRNLMAVRALGARVLSDLQGNVDFPKQTGAATLSWTGENPGAAVSASDQTFGKVSLSPKTAMAQTMFTRQFMVQSSIDIENLVRQDLATIVALGIDLAAINGSGASNQPTGIIGTSGVTVVALGTNGLAPDYNAIVDCETQLETNNIMVTQGGWLTTPGVKGKLRKTQMFASTNGSPVWDKDNVLGSYPAISSNQVPSTLTKGTSAGVCHAMIVGNWPDLLIGEWGAIEIIVDPYTQAGKGLIVITIHVMVDINVRYATSFTVIKDALIT
jgi:HK97 family phage major capsid protein